MTWKYECNKCGILLTDSFVEEDDEPCECGATDGFISLIPIAERAAEGEQG